MGAIKHEHGWCVQAHQRWTKPCLISLACQNAQASFLLVVLIPVYRRSLLSFEPADPAPSDGAEVLFLMVCQAVKMLADVPASWMTELLIIQFSTMFD
jgi:hypothetical protein